VDLASDWYMNAQRTEFINFDLESLASLPIENCTAEIAYSSHTVEHITDDAAQNMFEEAHRVLKPGGLLRITTPNIALEYAAYRRNDRSYFYWIDTYSKPGQYEHIYNRPLNEASIQQVFLSHFASQLSELHPGEGDVRFSDAEIDEVISSMGLADALNFFTSRCSLDIQKQYSGNHINWWSEAKMARMLNLAGFEKVYCSGYGQSFSPVLRNTSYFDRTHPKISLYMEAIKG